MQQITYFCLLWTTLYCYVNVPTVFGWPDGAPCVLKAYESMNPLEAVEHQGGLQLSPPPFQIEVKQGCYWFNQPIELTLKGNTTKTQFKGFAIQPYIYEGSGAGRRIGQFLRLDDNGSWRQQCFQRKDSVTHSHDEKKPKLTLWWKNDQDDSATIQFVATVVVSLKEFWVKSVLSDPIPPCKQKQSVSNWIHPAITAPPPVGRFKIDTFQMFNLQNSASLARSLANEGQFVPVARPTPTFSQPLPTFTAPPPVQTPTPVPFRTPINSFRPNSFVPQQPRPVPVQQPIVPQQQTRQRLTHVIPLPNMETNARPQQFNRRPFLVSSSTPSFNTITRQPQQVQCVDREPNNRCFGWTNFCRTSTFMRTSCRRTCHFC